jgi:hypothetical protein
MPGQAEVPKLHEVALHEQHILHCSNQNTHGGKHWKRGFIRRGLALLNRGGRGAIETSSGVLQGDAVAWVGGWVGSCLVRKSQI